MDTSVYFSGPVPPAVGKPVITPSLSQWVSKWTQSSLGISGDYMTLQKELPYSPFSHNRIPLSYVCRNPTLWVTPPALLRRSKYPIQYHSVHIRYSRGVSNLFSRTAAFSKSGVQIDSEGRFIFLMGMWESHACVYS